MSKTNQQKILILASTDYAEGIRYNDQFTEKLNDTLEQEGHIEWHNYHDIGLEFGTNHERAFLIASDIDLDIFKYVYFKSYFRFVEQAAAIAEYLRYKKIPFSSKELNYYVAFTKLTQLARLAHSGLPIPQSIFMQMSAYRDSYSQLVEKLGTPFIFKAIDGSLGKNNFLISDKRKFNKVLKKHAKSSFIAQRYIPNDSDLRLIILKDQIQLIIKRQRNRESGHLNNTSKGAKAYLVSIDDLSSKNQTIALEAARIMNRDVAGVDLMFHDITGEPYILEVNASPQIASGAFTEEKLKVYSIFFKNMLK